MILKGKSRHTLHCLLSRSLIISTTYKNDHNRHEVNEVDKIKITHQKNVLDHIATTYRHDKKYIATTYRHDKKYIATTYRHDIFSVILIT